MSKGFYYMGKTYVWHEKRLYRLPYESNKKWYELLECEEWYDKKTGKFRGFYLGSSRKSKLQIKAMLEKGFEIDFKLKQYIDTPF